MTRVAPGLVSKRAPIKLVIIWGFTGVLFLYFLGIGIGNIIRYNSFKLQLEKKHTQLLSELHLHQSLLQQEQRLNLKLFWEENARERLGMIRNGENVYKFLDEERE